MKALLYSDWCVIKGTWRQYPLPAIFIIGVALFTGMDWNLGPELLADHIVTTTCATGALMLGMFGYFGFFGSDEREGWEAMRLALPVTRGHVVRSRYVTLVAYMLAVELGVAALGMLVSSVVTLVIYGRIGMVSLSELLMGDVIILAGYLAYLAIETPIFFKLGLAKARMYFSLPFLACMLLALEPVRLYADNVGATISAVVDRIGSPWPLVAGGLAVAAALYYASLLLSERIYARREL